MLRPLARILTLFWALVVVAPVWSAAAGAGTPHDQGLLWRIEAAGRAPSHLLGTMHTTDPDVLQLPAQVLQAFGSSRSLTIELVMSEAVQQRIGGHMMLADGRALDAILGAERFRQVAAIGLLYGWPSQVVRAMKPWAVMAVFGIPPSELARQSTGVLPLDQRLQADAEARGLPVHGLESVEEQLSVFEEMPEATQISFLEMVVDQHDDVDLWFAELKRHYLARDTGGMLAMMRRQTAGSDPRLIAAFEERLVDRRNRLMAERMAPRLAEGGAFVAVGALHLPGEAGLVRLLEDRGYALTQVY